MKKTLAIILSALLAMATFTACSGNSSSTNSTSSAVSSEATGKVLKIGVIQFVTHPALDASYEGFLEGLATAGLKEGTDFTVDYQNAQGVIPNCSTIVDKFINDGSDLIFAIATPAAQAAANATKSIPIVITAVTDAVDAELVASNEEPGGNVTGTSDLGPIAKQIGLIPQLVPSAKKVGIFYCSSESNSVFQADIARKEAEALGYETMNFTVNDTNNIQQVTESMVGKVDAAYIPTDNMLANAMSTVAQVANEKNLPIIVGEEGMVNNGGLASYSINYTELGKLAGGQAAEILKGENTPDKMPILFQENVEFIYNKDTAAALNIEIPEELLA